MLNSKYAIIPNQFVITKKYFLTAISFLIIFFSCSKDDKENGDNGDNITGFTETCTPISIHGLDIAIDGDIDTEIYPLSPEYNNYILCIQDCAETSPTNPMCMMNCMNELGSVPAGGNFSLTLYITNTTAAKITYTVEPGDWFEPSSDDYQAMISPFEISIDIEPGETVTEVIPVFCLNSGKSAPDEDSDFTLCETISESECLIDIVNILVTKDLASLSFSETMDVQKEIWACTDGEEVDWDYLNSLPDL